MIEAESTADLGFARLDLGRQLRCGFPEVIFGEGKTSEGLVTIAKAMAEARQGCLITRLNPSQTELLVQAFPEGRLNRVGRTFWLPAEEVKPQPDQVTIVTAGTADLPVAQEAFSTLHAMGFAPDLISDVGVAGLHRLLSQIERIRQAKVVIAVAGMEAALPSVLGGLVAVPVIAVPTSVGYGSHMHGLAALLGMLNSCAANVCVVNIDAGFKAAYIAGLMLLSNRQRGV
ncbi:MAG TPA: nickel pincer cofactor biosynthesis protein LarB [Gemmatales bacterium]|nr:nickel pincer cofactor biosynthesis protein LarB [Gemmatales bacterium]HMP15407.1 nickel pincer cofactor biosynthesis protein LarB [Gemmatales bacterium]